MTVRSLCCVWLVACSVLPALAAEPDWPHYRGPTHDAHSAETGLADRWPATGPPLAWTRELGQGYSSFAAVGDRIYTQYQTLYGQYLVCLDADTGRTIWEYRYGWTYEAGGLYPGPRSTPTWHDGRVYFAGPEGLVGCVQADGGKLVWSVNVTKKFGGRGTDFGYSCSPLVIDGKVIFPVGGKAAAVVALDARTGETVWTGGDRPASYCTPLPIEFEGQRHVVSFMENTLSAYELSTGSELWQLSFSQGYDEHAASPLYREPYLLIAAPFQSGAKLYRLVRQEDGGVEPEPVWDNTRMSNDVASSVLVGNVIYGFDIRDPQSRRNRPSRGQFRCLDFLTGKEHWSADGVGQASMIAADGKLILFSDSGELILARENPGQYEELARTGVFPDEICWTSPALHRGRVYLRTQTRAACLDLRGATGGNPPGRTASDIPRATTYDVRPLIGGEREFPATVPEWEEFADWYAACLGIVAFAILLDGIARLIVRLLRRAAPSTGSRTAGAGQAVFWMATLVGGAIGSALINPARDEFVFTWPLALWAALQLSLNTITWAERQPDRRRARWWSRGAGLLLLAMCAAYFHFLRRLGLSLEWAFLGGLFPMFPLAAIAARLWVQDGRWAWLRQSALAAVSFSAFFWLSCGFLSWWVQVGS